MVSEALDLYKKAEKVCKGSSGFWSFISGGPDYDEAIQLYVQAANQFKILKMWSKGVECFNKAGDLSIKQGDTGSAANYYMECGNITKKENIRNSIEHYTKAIDLYNKSGRFSQSGKLYKVIAEAFEMDFMYKESLEYYKKAAEMYDMDEYSKSAYSACILKYADLVSLSYDNSYSGSMREVSGNGDSMKYIYEAITIYESEAKKALQNSLIKYNSKEYLFKAFLIVLSMNDLVDAEIKWDKYCGVDSSFCGTPQGQFLEAMLKLIKRKQNTSISEDEDTNEKIVNDFSKILEEYNNIYPVDDWKVHFLTIIKKNLARSNISIKQQIENNQIDLT
ncbi:hypothetical protein cand_008070 [Cryptosporidium andersoni]|uniref:Alpha-soluble NSF attachment protein n=1 Tax=Cryptosporidium andersoni TaxID=117008 RepID=A0A1J4MT31_9CRYT|nr:hypothetical protein cand_008070 [Cryptosporidium andersoni]